MKIINIKAIIVLILTLSLVSCGGGGSSEQDPFTQASCDVIGLNTKILNGNTCSSSAGSSVVRVIKVSGEGGLCTGSLITPDKVLTATHCFEGSGQYVVVSGDANNVEAGNVIDISIAPNYSSNEERLFNDIAIVTLDKALSVPLMPILLSRSAVLGESGFVYGYGKTETGDTSIEELKAGSMQVSAITENHLFVEFDGDGVNVCNGDSGGPLVVLADGQPAVAGVVSVGSASGCGAGDVTTYTNIQNGQILNWLASAAPNAVVR